MSNGDNLDSIEDAEDDDDTFYYEVEEIIQMHVTDNGTRMFEIKWKNYASEHNTWEPEHNLNCPSILKAFLEKNGLPKTVKKKKKESKKQTTTRPKCITNGSNKEEFFDDDEVEISTADNQKEQEEPKKKKRKNKELSLNDKKYEKQLQELQARKRESIASKRKLKEERLNEITKDSEEARKSQKNDKSNEISHQQQQNRDRAQQQTERKKVEEPKKIAAPFKLAISNDRNFNSGSSSSTAKPNTPTSSSKYSTNSDESFTALKRGTNSKPPPPVGVDINDLIKMVRPQQQRPPPRKSPFPPNYQPLIHSTDISSSSNNNERPTSSRYYGSNTTSKSTSSTSIPTSASTSQPSQPISKPHRPSPLSSPQTASISLPSSSTPTPSLPHKPQHLGSRSTTTAVPPLPPPSNLVDWSITDPRIRMRLQANKDHATASDSPHVPINRAPVPAVAHEAIGIKRQISNSKDPRMKPDNVKKLKYSNATAIVTPFDMETVLYNGSKFVATIKIEGKQTCYHEIKIKALVQAASNSQKEVRIIHTLPLKALNAVLKDRPISFMSILPKDHMVDLSKLKSYYQVNEMAGVVHHPDLPQALVFLAEVDIKKLTNVNRDTIDISSYTQLCAIFIDELTPRPKFLRDDIQYELDGTDITTPFAWLRVTEYLKFPEQLTKLNNKAKFLIYGHSDTSALLTKANNMLKAVQQPTTSYVMMFDRYNDTLFSRNLTKHKKEPSTQIWEFGVPNFSEGKMIPARQVFPNNSGGFITTDMENIIHNPKIITDICNQVGKFNAVPAMYGEWKFILPHNWIQQMKKLIKNTESGQRAKDAIVSIVVALSNDSIQILKLWCADTEDVSCVQYLDRVAHEKYATHQHFVYADDIESVPTSEQVMSIDFVQSSKIFSTFG